MTDFVLEPAACGYAATLHGLDLAQPLDEATLVRLRAAWRDYPVLCFAGQDLDPARLQAFGAQLGPFGDDPYVAALPGFPHVIEVRREARETAPIFGSQWHSDWSFQATPPSATLLYGAEVPPLGGDTLFANGYAACAGLSADFRAWLKTRHGVHSAAPSYGPQGLFARDDATRSMRIIVSADAERSERHPVIRRHAESGRETLYVNHVYTVGIEGLRQDESRAILDYLFAHFTRPEYQYRHRWQPGSLLMWDNRCVIHLATGGYEGHRRLMYRSTLAGERPLPA